MSRFVINARAPLAGALLAIALADAAVQAASARLEALTAGASQANSELVRHRKELGALAAQSYKTGGTNMGFFVAVDALQANSVHGLNVVKSLGLPAPPRTP